MGEQYSGLNSIQGSTAFRAKQHSGPNSIQGQTAFRVEQHSGPNSIQGQTAFRAKQHSGLNCRHECPKPDSPSSDSCLANSLMQASKSAVPTVTVLPSMLTSSCNALCSAQCSRSQQCPCSSPIQLPCTLVWMKHTTSNQCLNRIHLLQELKHLPQVVTCFFIPISSVCSDFL